MQPVELQQYNATVYSKIFDKSYFMSWFIRTLLVRFIQ